MLADVSAGTVFEKSASTRSGASLSVLYSTVTDGGRYRVPVAARPKYAPKLTLLSPRRRSCPPRLFEYATAPRALPNRGSGCRSTARLRHCGQPTRLPVPLENRTVA